MPIPEAQLDIWAKQGSVAQSRDTYATIANALESPQAPYRNRTFDVFLQGSYGNDTNVYAESDVDVVIRTDAVYYSDTSELSEGEKANYDRAFTPATYTYVDLKQEVTAWLTGWFGDGVDPGDKAIYVPGNGTRRDADVLPAAQYRRYKRFRDAYDQGYVEGICFWSKDGTQIINYPKQHAGNCTTKHQATAAWFKPTVRIVKNMRNRMVADRRIEDGLAPSYYIEGLLYNAPEHLFGRTYEQTITKVFDWLIRTDRTNFVCANEQYYLLREGSPVTWRADKCTRFLDAVADFWRSW